MLYLSFVSVDPYQHNIDNSVFLLLYWRSLPNMALCYICLLFLLILTNAI